METSAALGFFDGVHRAHQQLLNGAADEAARLGIDSLAVTFDRHPMATITGKQPPLLCTAADRERFILEYSRIGRVEQLAFDEGLMNMEPEAFVAMLAERFSLKAVFVGFDYTFGRGGRGNAELMKKICPDLGIDCHVMEMKKADGVKISSSAIRRMITEGEVQEAAGLMGRYYSFENTVRHGKALGRRLGFPTINVPVPEEIAVPAAGVYVCRVLVDGEGFNGLCNVAHGDTPLCEANIFEFDRDVYGKGARVELMKMLRPMRSFENVEKLREQMEIDKKIAESWFFREK